MPQETTSPTTIRARRVVADLRELAQLTSTPAGAQRLAWSDMWRTARSWFAAKVRQLGLSVEADAAGNHWVTLPGKSADCLLLGSHLDSVPNGGWLDGCLGVLAGLEFLRQKVQDGTPPVTLRLVDWADEEGRFGRSLLGSSAAAGTLRPDAVRHLVDRQGVALPTALADHGVTLDRILDAHRSFQERRVRAYLELHIEQGPVLESLGQAVGVVLGTVGLKRHRLRFTGQAAHAGSTPLPVRRDAFLAAAEMTLACRTIANRHVADCPGVVATVGQVRIEPNIPTAVPGLAEITVDQRALDAGVLDAMVEEAREASQQIAQAHGVAVEWSPVFELEPRLFDTHLIALAESVTGNAPRLPSGPLHDASEMARLVPTVMLFTSSTGGLSHCKEEDTPEAHLHQGIETFLRLADRVATGLSAADQG